MTPEAKHLKIMSIVTMFIGLGVVILGIVLCVADFDITDALVAGSGALDSYIGASGARKANVPSSAKGIVVPSILIGALCVIAGFVSHSMGAPLYSIVACAACGVLAAIVCLAAQRIVKALERI